MVKAPLGTVPQQYWDVFGKKRSIPEYPDNAPIGVPGKYARNVQQDHAFNNNISHGERKSNQNVENSQFGFSENAPAKGKSRVNDEEYLDAVENEYDLLLEDLVLEAAKEAGYKYRRDSWQRPLDPSNDVPWTMWVEDMDFEPGRYGPYPFVAHGDGAIDIDDIADDIRELWLEYDGTELDDDSLNPPDIVMSAGIFDDMGFVQYMWDNYFEEIYDRTGKTPAIKTFDGLIIMDEDQTRAKSLAPILYDDNGKVIPLSQRFNREIDDVRFSENAPTKRQSSLNEAWELFDNNSTPAAYYESNPRGFDLQTSNLLRGLMLRNGENIGGTLSDASMDRIAGIFSGANRRNALSLSLSSPVRVFEDVTGWGGRTAEERAKNVRNGNLLKNTYYEYGNLQAANRETWIAENMRPVIEATTKQNPVNSCPDGRGAAGAARRIRLRREGLSRLLCRRCRYAPFPPDMEEYEVPAGPGRCLNVRGPYRKPCRNCSAAP